MRPKVQIFLLSSRSHKVIISQSRFLSYSAIKIIFDVNAAPKIRIMSFISRNAEMCCWLLLYLHTTTTVQSVTYIRIKINNFLINILETGCLIKKLVSPLNFLGNWCGNFIGKNLQSHGVLYIIRIPVFCKFFFFNRTFAFADLAWQKICLWSIAKLN